MSSAAELTTTQNPRTIARKMKGMPTQDGAGVKLTRLIGTPQLPGVDPFLMLDAFGSDNPNDYIAGFPEHPHRGFETVTYMIEGRMRHRDSHGHEGLLQGGGVQWMTAGRGLVHSELPEQESGRMEGFQLWLNLPAADKMTPPGYLDIPGGAIPELELGGVRARVIAGESHGVAGAVRKPGTEPLYLDLHFAPGARFEQALPPGHNAFVYVYRGALQVESDDGATAVPSQRMAVLANGADRDGVRLRAADAGDGTRALLVAGRPLGEPIAQYGPFVMNTQAEVFQAVADFRAGLFGTPPGR